ncbi:zf-PARP-domain-containing protein, partial [Panus rudis PR-1116 ss-1]
RKGGYRVDYAANNRSKCKGPKPCQGTTITKGELRLASLVDFRGHTSFAFRHWGCTTPKVISNIKEIIDAPEDLDGFEELKPEDQEKIRHAWQDGKVAEEDIPESAKKEEGEGEDEEE